MIGLRSMHFLAFLALALLTGASAAGQDKKDDGKNGKKDDKKEEKKESVPLMEYRFNSKGWVAFSAIHEGKARLLTYSEVTKEKGLTVTNVPVFRIDDKDYVFGVSPTGKWIKENVELPKSGDGKKRFGHQHVWAVADVEITQTIEVIPSKTGKLDACLVRYTLENKGKEDRKIGLRKMIDTLVVDADNHPFALPGQKKVIRDLAEFRGEAVPDVVLALQNPDRKKPGLIAVFSLNPGKGMPPPDRVAMMRFAQNEMEAFGWEYPVRPIDDDAALVLWWNPRILQAGDRVDIGYALGLGEVDLDAPPTKK